MGWCDGSSSRLGSRDCEWLSKWKETRLSDVGLEFGCEDGYPEDIVGGVRSEVGSEVGFAFGCHVGWLEGSQLHCNGRPVGCLDGLNDGYDHGSISGLNDGSVDGSHKGLDDGDWVGYNGLVDGCRDGCRVGDRRG